MKHPILKIAFLILFGSVLFAACTTASEATTEATTEPSSETENVLRIYNWDTYIDPTILEDFEEAFGVTIEYETFDNNEELFEEMQNDESFNYDLIVPTDYMVEILRQEGLLTPLTKDNIPNFDNLDAAFIDPGYDFGNRHCVPYQWGTMGIGYNIEATGREIHSWLDLFDPEFAGRVALLDDARSTLAVILLSLNYSPNTTNADEIMEAANFLKEHADQIAAYAPDTGQDMLLAGEVDLTFEWSGDIFQIMEENPNIRYVIPDEGSIIWTDNMCIPEDASNKELAERFMNYILEPEVGATLSNFVRYGSPNQASVPFLNEEDVNNPALYPTETVREQLFFLTSTNVETDQLYVDAWDEVLASHSQ
ncbi:ABC transporter substrate-binding protein [Candidatus Leptofilum sp.]|uniref:ABC transporter substrate-binding protein n=1 Tax=Candidatus Leptofilum sp. TaxID=3241576 RepID=UPI003B5A88F2